MSEQLESQQSSNGRRKKKKIKCPPLRVMQYEWTNGENNSEAIIAARVRELAKDGHLNEKTDKDVLPGPYAISDGKGGWIYPGKAGGSQVPRFSV